MMSACVFRIPSEECGLKLFTSYCNATDVGIYEVYHAVEIDRTYNSGIKRCERYLRLKNHHATRGCSRH